MRTKTNNEPIYLIYRNGILHGRDLNYDNNLLATKCLALILYLNDWIRQVEDEGYIRNKFDQARIKSDIDVLINYEYNNVEYLYEEKITVIYEIKGVPYNRLVEGGQWVIMNLGGLSTKMKLQIIKI